MTSRTKPYWIGGAEDRLVVQRCQQCRAVLHPPVILCPHDHSMNLNWEAVSGRGHVEAFTVNHHEWLPAMEPPYVVALVSLVEDPRARILTNLVDVEPSEVTNGMAVRAVFEWHEDEEGDLWLPLFTPDKERP